MNKKFKKLFNKKSISLLCLSAVVLLSIELNSKSRLDRKPFKFDAGANNSSVSERAILLSGETIYNEETGFGWRNIPEYEFERKEFSRSRNSFTIDGVTGK